MSSQGPSLTRRRLLARAAGGAAALTAVGFGLNALRFSPTRGAPLYATGYNDDWWKYATADGADVSLPFRQVKSGGGQYIRQMIDWRVVQPTPASPLNFSHYEPLRRQAKAHGLRVLPHFLNCCPEFSSPRSSGDVLYPSPANYLNFGAFVAGGMDYFDEVSDTAEIWNEPNIGDWGALPPSVFAGLVGASCDAIKTYANLGVFESGPKRVVSGGITVSGRSLNGDWRDYQREFTRQVADRTFDFGLHSYDFRSFSGWTADALADDIASRALANVDDAVQALRSDQKVWLTETGVSAREPLGRSGQARALGRIADGLRDRPRCAAMIVHRLYPNPDDPDERPPTSSFFSTGVFDAPYGTPQEAYFRLGFSWAGTSEGAAAVAGRADL